ncbi:MAG TPA: hypothetical protein HPP87_04675 [Planctomycetes bacterium]|nr:hypothetical protein [Planctomycetota bacterium]
MAKENAKRIQTIEKTGKGIKLGMFIGGLVMVGSLIVTCAGRFSYLQGLAGFIIGLVILIVYRLGAWWYHG